MTDISTESENSTATSPQQNPLCELFFNTFYYSAVKTNDLLVLSRLLIVTLGQRFAILADFFFAHI